MYRHRPHDNLEFLAGPEVSSYAGMLLDDSDINSHFKHLHSASHSPCNLTINIPIS
ncbi:hypothetical protein PISMIDRAFT_689933 [Pisolithus microcarpus 441]|uniref:Uncharacterized protein n=1 Tax=Pisolithus microcarpus 441 TaxID=765257 RepID=A0A0C9YNV3_9AGAM|nr:hypothetical protein PISMIDRAFT_689933 [Pisolithus microcarpus 441]